MYSIAFVFILNSFFRVVRHPVEQNADVLEAVFHAKGPLVGVAHDDHAVAGIPERVCDAGPDIQAVARSGGDPPVPKNCISPSTTSYVSTAFGWT